MVQGRGGVEELQFLDSSLGGKLRCENSEVEPKLVVHHPENSGNPKPLNPKP